MRDIFTELFELQREYLEHVRRSLDADSAHPKQGPILGLLLAMDGVSQADLVRRLNVSAATVAVSIARLEKLGLVHRERNQQNQRANVLELTPAGRVQAQKLQQAMCSAAKLALDGVTEAEMQLLGGLLSKIAFNLKEAASAKDVTTPNHE